MGISETRPSFRIPGKMVTAVARTRVAVSGSASRDEFNEGSSCATSLDSLYQVGLLLKM